MPQDDTHSAQHQPTGPGSKRHFDLVDIITSRIPMPRKKSKTQVHGNTLDQSTSSADLSSSSGTIQQQSSQDGSQSAHGSEVSRSINDAKPTPVVADMRMGWYGSWKTKAKPVAEVALESATPANGAPASNKSPTRVPRKPSLQDGIETPSPKRYLSGSSNQSTKGTPIAATTTNIIISSNNSKAKLTTDTPAKLDSKNEPSVEPPNPPLPPEPSVSSNTAVEGTKETPQNRPVSSSGWFGGWWSRPDGYTEETAKEAAVVKQENSILEEAKNKPLPVTTPNESPEQSKVLQAKPIDIPQNGNGVVKHDAEHTISKSAESRSWFWTWSRAQDPRPSILPMENTVIQTDSTKDVSTPKNLTIKTITAEDLGQKDSKPGSLKDGHDGKTVKKSSGWGFWSNEPVEPESNMEGSIHKHVGEIAVANTPSQSNPEAAQFNMVEEAPVKETPKATSKRGRDRPAKKLDESASSTPLKSTPQPSPARKGTESASKQPIVKADRTKENLLLPDFNNTYSILQKPSIWQNIREYFVGTESHQAHLHLMEKPPRIKKALAIGIHGYFPPGIIQKLLGAPTGTSIKFSSHAAAAIKAWTEKNGYECEIEKVALEGEGLIADRVDTLWKLLLNWIEHVRSADLILLACHSQGVPVTIMLVERLIKFKCIGPNTRIGICAMAGVNLGPFEVYRTKWLGSAGFELFDFSNSSSKVSKDYLSALEEVLRFGVKIVYVGSLDDQLVSVESSTFSIVSHPCIYRAVFVDGRLHTSDFITELVGFALKLRNLGISDHGLIRELSPALGGPITGEGHSRLYDSSSLYDLTVSHTLDTTTPVDVSLIVRNYEGAAGSNPYFLPFSIRGMLEEEKVKKELADECKRLLELFEEWRPKRKELQDVKFRLEALKSRL